MFKINIMGRNKKSVLNQVVGAPKKEIEEDVVEESGAKLLAPEIEPVIPMEKPELIQKAKIIIGDDEVAMKSSKTLKEETESPTYPDDGKDEGEVGEEPAPRTLQSLSKAELRWFQRTGMMPK